MPPSYTECIQGLTTNALRPGVSNTLFFQIVSFFFFAKRLVFLFLHYMNILVKEKTKQKKKNKTSTMVALKGNWYLEEWH